MPQQKIPSKAVPEKILQFQTLDCSNVRSRRRETNVDSQLSGSRSTMLKPPREKDFAAVACVPLPSL